jgi:hypothetical protein
LLPSLHHKTHFKGIQEISNGIGCKIVLNQYLRVIKHSRELQNLELAMIKVQIHYKIVPNPEFSGGTSPKEETKSEMNTTKRNMKPRFDPAEASKKILLSCNLTR